MPSDLSTIADPTFILLAWSAGLLLSVAFVAFSRLVGPGYTWLTAGVGMAIALPAAIAGGAWWARAGLAAAVLGIVWARNHSFSGLLLAIGGVALAFEGFGVGGSLPTVSAALALGGVTGGMAMAHWYLVDPRLPRWPLRVLAVVGIVGIASDALLLWLGIGFPPGNGQIVYWVLSGTSVVMMAAAIGALRHPAYSGVEAATGLAYLSVLTTLGTVFLGRALAVGLGPFG